MKTELHVQSEKQGFLKLSKESLLMLILLTMVSVDAYCQSGTGTNAVTNQLNNFIKDWYPVLRIICGLAGIYCLVMAVINIFFRGEQGGATKLIYFLLGGVVLLALPSAVKVLFNIDI